MDIGKLILEEEITLGELTLDVLTEKPELEDLIVTPSKSTQEYVSQNYYGYNKVTVKPIGDEYIIPSGQKEVFANGEYDITEFAEVKVSVPEAKLGTKSITQNGTYRATDDGLDGYSEVNVETEKFSPRYVSFYNYQGTELDQELNNISFKNTDTCIYLFSNCSNLITIPLIDISNIKITRCMFESCRNLKEIPKLDTRNMTTMTDMFFNCQKLKTIPELEASNVFIVSRPFSFCSSLENFGGLKNLGQAYLTTQNANYFNYTLDLSGSTKLTEQSLINVLTNVYDIVSKGVKAQQIILGSTNLAKLTSAEGQAALTRATNYGWTVS